MTNGTQYILKVNGIEDYVEIPNHKDLSLAREEPSVVATATAIIDESTGEITEVTVNNPGDGYTKAPIVYFIGGLEPTSTRATAIANLGTNPGIDDDKVVSITVTNGGSGYTEAPEVALLGDRIGMTIYAEIRPDKLNFPKTAGREKKLQFVHFVAKIKPDKNREWALRMYNKSSDRPNRVSGYVFSPDLIDGEGSGSYFEYPKNDNVQIKAGEWIKVTFVVDNDYTYIYRNGTLKSCHPYSDIPIDQIKSPCHNDIHRPQEPQYRNEAMRVGTDYKNDYFLGAFREVRIYNRPLIDSEAASLANGTFTDTTNLVLWHNYRLGNAKDHSGRKHGGTLYGKAHFEPDSEVIDSIDPKDVLKIITDAKFTPLTKGEKELTISNFGNLTNLNSSPGSEIEVEGYVTYVSKVHRGESVGEQDLDVHFNISPMQGDDTTYLVCEIQNADEQKHKKPLDDARRNGDIVKVKGILRIFLEHISGPRHDHQFPHIFELHPVSSVIINGEELADITMDCPAMDDWRNNDSIYEMKLQADGSVLFKKLGQDWNSFPESVEAEFDGTNLTLRDVRTVGHNYVYMDGYFSKIQDGSFPDGKPYFFELKSADDDSIRIKSVVVPGVPAYNTAKIFHGNPPDNLVTAVAVRNLDIPQLLDNIYETILCPVYRLEQNNS